ncbi:response regulator transcription factor [Gloeocapsopsis dulcis]|uniref:Response regulator n=1 Tax=Gloeocapsopsis dulcis AAB1 = 1H9 TaxID=1433147 RepID=A0A6N8G3B2_9CHRO|nr:response regulator [Gloeocapsopsis dulcis]MUL38596.1 response regulator [Gloeocapsopsis dulcis AAB1 = 1H9]WNN91156.1 response regulator [Gloeocapsopsis dulcis]
MKKILVIEDEPPVRANIVDLLEFEDFEVVSAENGFLGALWAQEHLPDLIICDVMMPEINGYEVLHALHQDPMTATIPFIFLTAMADKADIRHGIEQGADDYLTKPFSADELLGAIATRLAKHETVMQQYNQEHQRTIALQQQLHELEQYIDSKDELLEDFQQKLHRVVSKLNLALHLLKKIPQGMPQERCLKLLQTICVDEIALFNKMPALENFISSENTNVLHQFHLVDDDPN